MGSVEGCLHSFSFAEPTKRDARESRGLCSLVRAGRLADCAAGDRKFLRGLQPLGSVHRRRGRSAAMVLSSAA